MYFDDFYRKEIIVYIEEYNKDDNIIIFDFVDSNFYSTFSQLTGVGGDISNSSMALVTNYKKRRIQEDTYYLINRKFFVGMGEGIITKYENSDLFGFIINLPNELTLEFFGKSIGAKEIDFYCDTFFYRRESVYDFDFGGHYSVNIRNVGQGNWNEIVSNDEVKIVFDAGANMYASKDEVREIIGNRSDMYSDNKPILVLSHWDKDHYMSLISMTDLELQNFSSFICRATIPNLTSRKLFVRIENAIGAHNIHSLPAEPRISKGGLTHLILKTKTKNAIWLFNAQAHKNRNISGIVLLIRTGIASIILSGDVHYEQISDCILQHINYPHSHYLIVPHHGGKAGNLIYKLNKATPRVAVISVGENRYWHPLAENVQLLKSLKFKVEQTRISNSDIRINLY